MDDDFPCPLTINWEGRPDAKCPRVVQGYNIDTSYLLGSDTFSIDLYDTDKARLRYLLLEPLTLSIYGQPQLIGRVEHVHRGSGTVTISGRDYRSDLAECNVDPTFTIKKDMTLGNTIREVCSPCGITKVVGDDSLTLRNVLSGKNIKVKKKHEDFGPLKLEEHKPEVGMGILDFCSRLAARHGCIIQPGTKRSELVLSKPTWDQDPTYKFFRTDDPDLSKFNNVLDADSDENGERIPTYCVFTAKAASAGGASKPCEAKVDIGDVLAELSARLAAVVNDKYIAGRRLPRDSGAIGLGQLYRLLILDDKDSKNRDQLDRSAARALGDRLKDLLEYSPTLQDHKYPKTGAIYAIDTVAQCDDAICDVADPLWVAKRTFNYAKGSGATTRLTCWHLGSLQM